jgi:hypothetical protein
MFPVQRYIQRKTISDLGHTIPNKDGLKGFIRAQSYGLNFEDRSSELFIEQFSQSNFISAISHDYSRFALSGIESYGRALRSVGQENTAWPAIQMYYSAYYFANSILRGCGVSLSRFSRLEVRALNELRNLFGVNCGEFTQGEYRAAWVPSASVGARVKLEQVSSGSGAHERFWIVFADFIEELISEIQSQKLADELEAVNSAVDLLKVLRARSSGNHNWLSVVRNEVTYQHAYSVWTPNSKKDKDVRSLRALTRKDLSVVRLDHNPNSAPLDAFLSGCQYVIELGILIAEHLAALSKRNGTFGARWARCLEIQEF